MCTGISAEVSAFRPLLQELYPATLRTSLGSLVSREKLLLNVFNAETTWEPTKQTKPTSFCAEERCYQSTTFVCSYEQFLEILENKSQHSLGRFLHLSDKTYASLVPYSLIQYLCIHRTGFLQSETTPVSCGFRFPQEIFTQFQANREYSV